MSIFYKQRRSNEIIKIKNKYYAIKSVFLFKEYWQVMTDKEIYKARAEGFNRVAELRNTFKSGLFLELLDLAFSVVKENSNDYEKHRDKKIFEKVKYRLALNKLFIYDKL